MQQRGEQAALQATAVMQQGHLAGLDVATAIFAATLGLQTRLPLADSVVLPTARAHNAVVWTQDADFEGLEDVRSACRSLEWSLPSFLMINTPTIMSQPCVTRVHADGLALVDTGARVS